MTHASRIGPSVFRAMKHCRIFLTSMPHLYICQVGILEIWDLVISFVVLLKMPSLSRSQVAVFFLDMCEKKQVFVSDLSGIGKAWRLRCRRHPRDMEAEFCCKREELMLMHENR